MILLREFPARFYLRVSLSSPRLWSVSSVSAFIFVCGFSLPSGKETVKTVGQKLAGLYDELEIYRYNLMNYL